MGFHWMMLNSSIEVRMRRQLLAPLLVALLLAFAFPQASPAKALTVKIVISGGKLPDPIEIMDKHILAASDIWIGSFLDTTRPPIQDPPGNMERYEVIFYVKYRRDDIRKAYAVYYSPAHNAEPGLIYLPGRGDPWEDLNAGTVEREGRDGKWNYASPQWEDMIKLAIVRAQTPQHHTSR
jgi:hypothetical protein